MVALPGDVVAADASWWKGRRGTSSAGAAQRQPQSRLQLDVAEEEGRADGDPTEADADGAAHRVSIARAIFHSANAIRADVEHHQIPLRALVVRGLPRHERRRPRTRFRVNPVSGMAMGTSRRAVGAMAEGKRCDGCDRRLL